MPVPTSIMNTVAALQNDPARTRYTYEAMLPYLNIALRELQEIFEENNIPVTNETVPTFLTVPAGTTIIAFTGTTPTLPSNLIEIQRIWEGTDGINWVPMEKRDFIPPNLLTASAPNSSFGVWAWVGNEVRVPPAAGIILLKIQYIKSLFAEITPDNMDTDLGEELKNIQTYLEYETSAICSMFIGENETRAGAQHDKATEALDRALNIPTKGRQSIMTRRRPFRQAYKSRGWY